MYLQTRHFTRKCQGHLWQHAHQKLGSCQHVPNSKRAARIDCPEYRRLVLKLTKLLSKKKALLKQLDSQSAAEPLPSPEREYGRARASSMRHDVMSTCIYRSGPRQNKIVLKCEYLLNFRSFFISTLKWGILLVHTCTFSMLYV